ncbi:hypothetical protein [Gluconobacter cerinus]|uniref:hypothetical protein n=1 Tax=Gluconobacter cerinus TaxID=38307 RepID=UPI001B8D7893|nr:hypothetical protein [Gluconobacter cerinus]MBS1035560.1 hypothetical protein [Gluconobacter cerinus]
MNVRESEKYKILNNIYLEKKERLIHMNRNMKDYSLDEKLKIYSEYNKAVYERSILLEEYEERIFVKKGIFQ